MKTCPLKVLQKLLKPCHPKALAVQLSGELFCLSRPESWHWGAGLRKNPGECCRLQLPLPKLGAQRPLEGWGQEGNVGLFTRTLSLPFSQVQISGAPPPALLPKLHFHLVLFRGHTQQETTGSAGWSMVGCGTAQPCWAIWKG